MFSPSGSPIPRQPYPVNPGVASHGGFVNLLEVKDNVAYIQLGGGCQGCAQVDVTLKQGIEVAIQRQVPEIVAVRDTTDHAAGTNPYLEGLQEVVVSLLAADLPRTDGDPARPARRSASARGSAGVRAAAR